MVVLSVLGSFLGSVGIIMFLPLITNYISNDSQSIIIGIIQNAMAFLNIDLTILSLTMLIFLFLFAKAVIVYINEIYQEKVVQIYRVDTITRLFSSFYQLKWTKFINEKRGFLIDYVISITTRNSILLRSLAVSISTVITSLVYLIFACLVSTRMTLLVIAVFAFVSFIYVFVLRKVRYYGHKLMVAGNQLSKLIEQYLNGFKTIRAYNSFKATRDRINIVAEDRKENTISMVRYNVGFKVILDFLLSGVVLLIVVVFVIILKNPVSDVLIVSIFLAKILQESTKLHSLSSIATNLPGIERFERIFKRFTYDMDPGLKIPYKEIGLKENIVIDNVSYSYKEKCNENVVNRIILTIKKGEMVAFVGPSGAGKTTIVDLFLGLLRPTKGSISIDETDISKVNPEAWRNKIGYVAQEGFLLNDTIENNISFFRKIGKKDMIDASKLANSYEFIMHTENGFNTIVGDNGVKLSGGQKQRICLARALAGKPDILILDEATSSLDSASENYIKKSIDNLKRDVTTIAVAHRLSTVANADKIVVLDKGRVVEMGNQEQLLRKDGLYKRMYDEQVRSG